MSSINPLKRRVAALVEARFKRELEQMSNEELLEFAKKLEERRAGAMDARATGRPENMGKPRGIKRFE